MGTVHTRATVSHAYYARKPRRETVRRIRELAQQLGEEPPRDAYMDGCTRDGLADIAMALHRKFPDEGPAGE